jgi:hypothetical protein
LAFMITDSWRVWNLEVGLRVFTFSAHFYHHSLCPSDRHAAGPRSIPVGGRGRGPPRVPGPCRPPQRPRVRADLGTPRQRRQEAAAGRGARREGAGRLERCCMGKSAPTWRQISSDLAANQLRPGSSARSVAALAEHGRGLRCAQRCCDQRCAVEQSEDADADAPSGETAGNRNGNAMHGCVPCMRCVLHMDLAVSP